VTTALIGVHRDLKVVYIIKGEPIMANIQYALFGATGTVGKALSAKLAERGQRFRVVGRSEERLRQNFGGYEPLVEYCAANLSDPVSAARAAAGVDIIFYTVGVPYPQFEQHPKLSRVALEAAAGAGVRHFVHLSTVYPYGVPQQEFVSESHPRNPTAFKGRMRKEQEDLVLAADDPKGMRTTILRPPDFYGPDAELSYVRAIFDAALNGGTANVIGPIDTQHEFIFVPDVAETLIALSEKQEAYGKAWNVAGPGLITTRQFADQVFREVHQKPRLRVAGKVMLRVLGVFNPFLRELVEMHYLWTTPVKLDDTRLRHLLPNLHETSYAEGIRVTIKEMQSRAVPVAA
jgi:nucleoside-diphosphate-sugar epimerase